MDGLLLRLRDDMRGSPGRWFWPCFEPLRTIIDCHYWIFSNNPWMGAPAEFDNEPQTADYPGAGKTSITLWRPGVVGRWAGQFCEEHIDLWAVHPDDDPVWLASEFSGRAHEPEPFIERHAAVWLIYTDSTCWEIFAKDTALLEALRCPLQGKQAVRVYPSQSGDRGRAFARAGRSDVWRALNGEY